MAANPLPIAVSVARAYRTVGELIGHLPRAVAAPYILSLLLALPIVLMPDNLAVQILFGLLGPVPNTLFAVAWHRLVILGPQVATPPPLPAWKRRHWRFLGYSLLFIVLSVLPLSAMAFVVGALSIASGSAPAGLAVLTVPLIIAQIYLVLRWCLVLPASTLDEDYRLRHSWAHSKGQVLRLLAILVLILVPMIVLMLIAGSLLGAMLEPGGEGQLSAGQFVLFHLVTAVISYLATALWITAISQAFRDLAGWYPGPQHQA